MKEESFGIIVLRSGARGREVLLVRTDHWGFPKGHAEEGEDPISAALRETKEEAGIDARIVDGAGTYSETYEVQRDEGVVRKTVTYWVGEGEGDPIPRPGETFEARWVPADEAKSLLSYESSKALLDSVI